MVFLIMLPASLDDSVPLKESGITSIFIFVLLHKRRPKRPIFIELFLLSDVRHSYGITNAYIPELVGCRWIAAVIVANRDTIFTEYIKRI